MVAPETSAAITFIPSGPFFARSALWSGLTVPISTIGLGRKLCVFVCRMARTDQVGAIGPFICLTQQTQRTCQATLFEAVIPEIA